MFWPTLLQLGHPPKEKKERERKKKERKEGERRMKGKENI